MNIPSMKQVFIIREDAISDRIKMYEKDLMKAKKTYDSAIKKSLFLDPKSQEREQKKADDIYNKAKIDAKRKYDMSGNKSESTQLSEFSVSDLKNKLGNVFKKSSKDNLENTLSSNQKDLNKLKKDYEDKQKRAREVYKNDPRTRNQILNRLKADFASAKKDLENKYDTSYEDITNIEDKDKGSIDIEGPEVVYDKGEHLIAPDGGEYEIFASPKTTHTASGKVKIDGPLKYHAYYMSDKNKFSDLGDFASENDALDKVQAHNDISMSKKKLNSPWSSDY